MVDDPAAKFAPCSKVMENPDAPLKS